MLLQAQKDFDLDLSQSILVGDKNTHIEAGIKASVGQNYLITTGHKITENLFNVKLFDTLKDLKNEVTI